MTSENKIQPGAAVAAPAGMQTFVVFDVESIGLHGEGFAVGYVVINRAGETLDEGLIACDPLRAQGEPKNLAWVQENVPSFECGCFSPFEVREQFWGAWQHWKGRGAALVADCCWPVEARFLAACVDDAKLSREWEGPYPLLDLASVLLAIGRDPLAANERQPSELPAHHPLMDARQSARLLIEALSSAQPAQAPAAAPQELSDEREAFEKWADANGFNTHRDDTPKYREYHRATTNWAWQAWQARALLSAQPAQAPAEAQAGVPDGWRIERTQLDGELAIVPPIKEVNGQLIQPRGICVAEWSTCDDSLILYALAAALLSVDADRALRATKGQQ
jgi:hypothetical protein